MTAIINTKLVMEDGIIWDGALTFDNGKTCNFSATTSYQGFGFDSTEGEIEFGHDG